jgi:hypothetical protein
VPGNPGVVGQGVTLLNGGLAVSSTNPLPVTGPGGYNPPYGAAAEQRNLFALTANGETAVIPGVAGKQIYVTGYNFSLTNASDVYFGQSTAGAQLSARGFGVLAGDEIPGQGETFLFAAAPGVGVSIYVTAGLAAATPGSVQIRFRVA